MAIDQRRRSWEGGKWVPGEDFPSPCPAWGRADRYSPEAAQGREGELLEG